MNKQFEYDVFLAYNSQDKPLVKFIAEELKKRDLKPYLDVDEVLPGEFFQDSIQQAIQKTKSAAIFFGLLGLGRWQKLELKALINQCVKRNIPVIPILLPGVKEIPEDLPFSQEIHCVSFADGVYDIKALDLLQAGIVKSKAETQANSGLVHDLENKNSQQKELESLHIIKKSQQLTVEWLEELVERMEKDLKNIQTEKQASKCRIAELNKAISLLENELNEELNQEEKLFLGWLEEQEKNLSQASVEKALKKLRSNLSVEIDEELRKLIDWTAQKFLEIIRDSFYEVDEDYDYIELMEELHLPAELSELYREVLKCFEKRIFQRKWSDKVRTRIMIRLKAINKMLIHLNKI